MVPVQYNNLTITKDYDPGAVAEAGRTAFLLSATCAVGVGRLRLTVVTRLTRAREENKPLSRDMLMADGRYHDFGLSSWGGETRTLLLLFLCSSEIV